MKDRRKAQQKAAFAVITGMALATVASLAAIVGYVAWKGLPALNIRFLAGEPGNPLETGIWPMAVNTLYLVLLTLAIAMPLGILAAIFLKEYAKEGFLVKLIRAAAENLAGVPSIVFGLFGLVFFGKALNLGWSLSSGALTASIIVLPTIMRTTEEAIASVPGSYREASLALGATRWQTIKGVVMLPAMPGIMAGAMLSIGRVAGETAALIFTLGSSDRAITSLTDSGRTLSMHLYILAHEGLSVEGAFATATVLIIVVLALNMASDALSSRAMKGRER